MQTVQVIVLKRSVGTGKKSQYNNKKTRYYNLAYLCKHVCVSMITHSPDIVYVVIT
jgi:hypothetical protein